MKVRVSVRPAKRLGEVVVMAAVLLMTPSVIQASNGDDEEGYVTRGYCNSAVSATPIEPVPIVLADLGLSQIKPDELPSYNLVDGYRLAGGEVNSKLAAILPNVAGPSVLVLKPEDHPIVNFMQMVGVNGRGVPGTSTDSSWDGAISENAEQEYDGNVRRYANAIRTAQAAMGQLAGLTGYEATVSHRLFHRLSRGEQIAFLKATFGTVGIGGSLVHAFPATLELGGSQDLSEIYAKVRELVEEALGTQGYQLAVYVGNVSLERGPWNDNRLGKKLEREGMRSGIGTQALLTAYTDRASRKAPEMIRMEIVRIENVTPAEAAAPEAASSWWSALNVFSWFGG